jgi:hypothetical protein
VVVCCVLICSGAVTVIDLSFVRCKSLAGVKHTA